MKTNIQENYKKIKDTINQKSILFKKEIKLVAVSKTKPVEDILSLYELGQNDFAENYVNEFLEKKQKIESLGIKDIQWHFIGQLQSNKIKQIFNEAFCIHSLCSESSLKQMDKIYSLRNNVKKQKIFIQVNVDSEETKSGCQEEDLKDFIEKTKSFQCIELLGLMCIPDPQKNKKGESFLKLKNLKEKYFKNQKCELSMGMSDDYLLAIEHGSTLIRLGSVLFGKRE